MYPAPSNSTSDSKEALAAIFIGAVVILALLPGLFWVATGAIPETLLAEGGPYEHGSALASFLASLCFFLEARYAKSNLRKFWLVALAFGCFLLAGEEVSWGQHLFPMEVPEYISSRNFQQELNLHNLTIIQSHNNEISTWLFRALMGYLVLLPILVRVFPSFRRILETLSIPIPSLTIALAALLAKAADIFNHELIYGNSFSTDSKRVGEAVESLYQLCLIAFAIELTKGRDSMQKHFGETENIREA